MEVDQVGESTDTKAVEAKAGSAPSDQHKARTPAEQGQYMRANPKPTPQAVLSALRPPMPRIREPGEGPAPGPFLRTLPEAVRASLHKKKMERVPLLKTAMREMLVSAAGVMDPVPSSEKLVLSVSLAYWPHEDTSGLPTQIVMQAQRKTLMGFLMSGSDKAALEAAIQVREY